MLDKKNIHNTAILKPVKAKSRKAKKPTEKDSAYKLGNLIPKHQQYLLIGLKRKLTNESDTIHRPSSS